MLWQANVLFSVMIGLGLIFLTVLFTPVLALIGWRAMVRERLQLMANHATNM